MAAPQQNPPAGSHRGHTDPSRRQPQPKLDSAKRAQTDERADLSQLTAAEADHPRCELQLNTRAAGGRVRQTQTDDGPGVKRVGWKKGCTTGLEPCRARVAESGNRTERKRKRERESPRVHTHKGETARKRHHSHSPSTHHIRATAPAWTDGKAGMQRDRTETETRDPSAQTTRRQLSYQSTCGKRHAVAGELHHRHTHGRQRHGAR